MFGPALSYLRPVVGDSCMSLSQPNQVAHGSVGKLARPALSYLMAGLPLVPLRPLAFSCSRVVPCFRLCRFSSFPPTHPTQGRLSRSFGKDPTCLFIIHPVSLRPVASSCSRVVPCFRLCRFVLIFLPPTLLRVGPYDPSGGIFRLYRLGLLLSFAYSGRLL